MHDPITVNYIPRGEKWRITVVGEGQIRTGTATGLIAARDHADTIIKQLTRSKGKPTVVHLLDGDAFAFTTSYLHARLGWPQPSSAPVEITETATAQQTVTTPTVTTEPPTGAPDAQPSTAADKDSGDTPREDDAQDEPAETSVDTSQPAAHAELPTQPDAPQEGNQPAAIS